MPLIPPLLAAEMLAAIGGQVTPQRLATFQALANAICAHIIKNATVTVQNVQPGVGVVVTPGPGAIT